MPPQLSSPMRGSSLETLVYPLSVNAAVLLSNHVLCYSNNCRVLDLQNQRIELNNLAAFWIPSGFNYKIIRVSEISSVSGWADQTYEEGILWMILHIIYDIRTETAIVERILIKTFKPISPSISSFKEGSN